MAKVPRSRGSTKKPLLVVDPEIHDFLYCAQCSGDIGWPKSLSAQEKRGFAELRRRNDWQTADSIAQGRFSLGAREAKALYLHVTNKPGECHRPRCKSAISGTASCCPVCQSVNLDW